MKIEVAKDPQTGFPYLRPEGEQDFVSLFPITKVQAEHWLWKAGACSDDIIDRLEVRHTGDMFPKPVGLLTRAPIPHLRTENLLALVATNLTVWDDDKELLNRETIFPTEASEFGRLVRWLGGWVPSYEEWASARDSLARVPTVDIIEGVAQSAHLWEPLVERLLWKVRDALPRDAAGMPFMQVGLYELISEPEHIYRQVEHQRHEVRPQVMGDSPIWPSIDTIEMSKWRPLRRRSLPVVTARVWCSAIDLIGKNAGGEFKSFSVTEAPAGEEEEEASKTGAVASVRSWIGRRLRRPAPLAAKARRELSRFAAPSPEVMRHRCPFCHEKVDPAVFMTRAHFGCYEEWVAVKNEDGSDARRKVRRHSIEIPNTTVYEISRRYLDVAQKHPGSIHTVALSGAPEAGKTTWMLGFGGLLDYPDGESRIFQAFPFQWSFRKKPCSLSNFGPEQDNTDRKLATELMWLDGILPVRNTAGERAFRYPLLFSCKPDGDERRIFTNLYDIAGDLLLYGKLARNPNFPHVPWTSDALYFFPADLLNSTFVDSFIEQMRSARRNEVALDLKKVNLIFVISKIDQLKYGTPKEQDLYRRILPRPYWFPADHDADALRRYVEEMYEVHREVEDWMYNNKQELTLTLAEEFGAVRYCGLSAFGFQPQRTPRAGLEYVLPFRPTPVRVADPIFWLLIENKLIAF